MIHQKDGGQVGQTISHYKIIEKLGAGGMGIVYKAEDTKLRRQVALKFLPTELTSDPDAKERFVHEAQAASALNHPNICSIHAIGEYEGRQFIDMEFVEGKTLTALLREKELSLNDVLEMAIQIGEGLNAAHKKGIIHRDIKPDNIMLADDGPVKIMDFGLAKLGGASKLTKTHSTLGTLFYMSPEQVQGLEVDQRTDIFSLGAVLYEMVAGRRPFRGEHEAAVIYSILNESPEPMARYRANVPDALSRVVEKALLKDRDHRYQHVDDMIADIKSIKLILAPGSHQVETKPQIRKRKRLALYGGVIFLLAAALLTVLNLIPKHAVTIDSIAVLPLENLSHDPEQEYFSDGMTEALITELSQISALKKVISRTSVMVYKGARKPLPEIAHELNVSAIVEGSILRAGTKVRVSVQLIDASADKHLWAKNYEREMKDILALQGEVAQAIAREINLTLTPKDETRLRSARQIDPKAHERYLKGRYFWNKRTGKDLQKAAECFSDAICIDSGYALAYSGLADCYNLLPFYGDMRPKEAYPKARAAVLRAISIDSTLAEAATSLAYYLFSYEWNWREAELEFKRAIELNPRYATAHHWYSVFLSSMKRFTEGLQEIQKAQELDPLSLIVNANYGDILFRAHRYDDAILQYRKTLEIDSTFSPAITGLAETYFQKHMYREALAIYPDWMRWLGKIPILVALGRTEEARDILSEVVKESQRTYFRNDAIAVAYLGIGDVENALDFLEKGVQEREPQLPEDLNVNPYWDLLRKNPRFIALLKVIGFEN